MNKIRDLIHEMFMKMHETYSSTVHADAMILLLEIHQMMKLH